MTEEEAKKKLCPFLAQLGGMQLVAYTMTVTKYPKQVAELSTDFNEKCVGSDCVMWRQQEEYITDQSGETSGYYSKTSGYCGLTK